MALVPGQVTPRDTRESISVSVQKKGDPAGAAGPGQKPQQVILPRASAPAADSRQKPWGVDTVSEAGQPSWDALVSSCTQQARPCPIACGAARQAKGPQEEPWGEDSH